MGDWGFYSEIDDFGGFAGSVVPARGFLGCREDRRQLVGLLQWTVGLLLCEQAVFHEQVEPAAAFVGFLRRRSDLRDELGPAPSAACSPIVRVHGRRCLVELTRQVMSRLRLRHPRAEVDDQGRKCSRSRLQSLGLLIHAAIDEHVSCRRQPAWNGLKTPRQSAIPESNLQSPIKNLPINLQSSIDESAM
jgi:hypothetical protein